MNDVTTVTQHTNRCYMLIGFSGSGKSHWCDLVLSRWKDALKPSVVCEDDLIADMCKETGESFNDVLERCDATTNASELKRRFNGAIGVRRDIIVDACNVSEHERSIFLHTLPDYYQRIGIMFTAPSLVLHQRLNKREQETGRFVPAHVIDQQRRRFQGPGRYEFHRTTSIDHLCAFN